MKYLELFVGAGGLALGISQAGFQPVAMIEVSRPACETIRLNQKEGVDYVQDWNLVEEDVRKLSFSSFGSDIDLISGGVPCQPFSLGGKHRGPSDHRNLFPEAIRAIREIQPKAFLFENVKGLARNQFRDYFRYLLLQLSYPELEPKHTETWEAHLRRLAHYQLHSRHVGLHYNVVYSVLNAADFGVPQRRERVFIVGIRSDIGDSFIFPRPTHSFDRLLYEQWVTGEYWERNHVDTLRIPPLPENIAKRVNRLRNLLVAPPGHAWRTVREAISDLPPPSVDGEHPTVPNHRLVPGARSYPGHTGSPLDEPAKTLKAGVHGVPGGENTLRLPDNSVRYFTVRECADLQTFPRNYQFAGSWTECMRQVGNAVPVILARAVAQRLYKQLSNGS